MLGIAGSGSPTPAVKYLFILSPPYSGSTVLWRLIQTSGNVSSMATEGQFVDSVRPIMRADPWNASVRLPWQRIKDEWSKHWDPGRPIHMEKSPPNLIRADEIENVFQPAHFVALHRDPYAICEGLNRRRGDPPMEGTENWKRDAAVLRAANLWVRFSRALIENIRDRRHIMHFTYEQLTAHPEETAARLASFLPELADVDVNTKLRSHAVSGTGNRRLVNMNAQKFKMLRRRDIDIINGVLEKQRDILHFFGYDLMSPGDNQDLVSHLESTRASLQRYPRAALSQVSRLLAAR